jgi:hypothetical protein
MRFGASSDSDDDLADLLARLDEALCIGDLAISVNANVRTILGRNTPRVSPSFTNRFNSASFFEAKRLGPSKFIDAY